MLAWLPEHIIYGKPYILDVVAVSGATVAHARDTHYHNPPDYLVLEPEDTTERTRNLQQTNTNGYKLQTTDHAELAEASRIVQSWGSGGATYRSTPEYRQRLRGATLASHRNRRRSSSRTRGRCATSRSAMISRACQCGIGNRCPRTTTP